MDQRISNHITVACLILLLGFSIGFCIANGMNRPLLVCRIWSYSRNDWKTVACYKTGSDVRHNGQPEPTETSIVYDTPEPTDTDIPWEPWATATRTATPPFITHTPYPAPETPSTPYP